MARPGQGPRQRRILRAVLALAACVAFCGQNAGATATADSAQTNPYSPAYQHPYRHGVIPTIPRNAKMKAWAAAHPKARAATSLKTLSYAGGINGIGVNSGMKSQVYLVFYGNQWGTESTNGSGDATFSGDPQGAAPVTQEMFKGIGTGGEQWSAELTQWCDGPNAVSGATSCPSNANFIFYQWLGVLAGVWYDNSAASPAAATAQQLGEEAVAAATHFGNTTPASNRNAYYVILSPTGTNPDNYAGNFCAWHSWASDTTGDLAFENQPYNIDQGASCGAGTVNGSGGALDGYTITLGHEWHEMMSDQLPEGGWANHTGSSYNQQEDSDECAWTGLADVAMGTGTFAEQPSWSNDTNSCAIWHPIVHEDTSTLPYAAIYRIDTSGNLHRWSYASPLDGTSGWSENTIGVGWTGFTIVPGGDGTLFAIAPDGTLRWYQDNNFNLNAGQNWAAGTGAVVGTGWGGFTTVIGDGHGVIYAIDTSGNLHWYRYTGTGGSFTWAPGTGTAIGNSWNTFTKVFDGGSGVIYALTSSGNLMWYRHLDPSGGTPTWAAGGTGLQIGAGWNVYPQIASMGGGVIFALDANGLMHWYRDTNPLGGTANWAARSGVSEGGGWAAGPILLDILGCIAT